MHTWEGPTPPDERGRVTYRCTRCGLTVTVSSGETPSLPQTPCGEGSADPAASAPAPVAEQFPSLARQAWSLVRSLADFIADGCQTVDATEYRRRLEACDPCESRRDNRCLKCGCSLSLKARGRAFTCPLGKWPSPDLQEHHQP